MSHHARQLLAELDAGWLEVCKVPTKDGYLRVPVSVNATWYQTSAAAT